MNWKNHVHLHPSLSAQLVPPSSNKLRFVGEGNSSLLFKTGCCLMVSLHVASHALHLPCCIMHSARSHACQLFVNTPLVHPPASHSSACSPAAPTGERAREHASGVPCTLLSQAFTGAVFFTPALPNFTCGQVTVSTTTATNAPLNFSAFLSFALRVVTSL